jgi:hypothetical protein
MLNSDSAKKDSANASIADSIAQTLPTRTPRRTQPLDLKDVAFNDGMSGVNDAMTEEEHSPEKGQRPPTPVKLDESKPTKKISSTELISEAAKKNPALFESRLKILTVGSYN